MVMTTTKGSLAEICLAFVSREYYECFYAAIYIVPRVFKGMFRCVVILIAQSFEYMLVMGGSLYMH